MNNNTLWIVGGGLAVVYLLTKKPTTVMPYGTPGYTAPGTAAANPGFIPTLLNLFKGASTPAKSSNSGGGATVPNPSSGGSVDVFGNSPSSPYYGLEPDPNSGSSSGGGGGSVFIPSDGDTGTGPLSSGGSGVLDSGLGDDLGGGGDDEFLDYM